jgi:hypothetical protein
MRSLWKAVALGALFGGLLLQPASAADVTTDDIKLGTHVMGPRLSEADLKGKVVVLEFWHIL